MSGMARAAPFIHDRPAAEALAAWQEACAAAGCPERVETVRLSLDQTVGRVTAEPVWATRSSPPFDAAAMDGIAVRAADTVGASETSPVVLPDGSFEIVDTGDPVPGDFDAVVMREDVHEVDDDVELRSAAAPYQHVRSIGEDVSAAELLLPSGHRLRPVDVAAAGAAGATELVGRRRARRGSASRHELHDARRPGRGGRLRGAPLRDHARRAGGDSSGSPRG